MTLREKGIDCEALNSSINVWLMDCLSSGAGVKRGTGVGGVFVVMSFFVIGSRTWRASYRRFTVKFYKD